MKVFRFVLIVFFIFGMQLVHANEHEMINAIRSNDTNKVRSLILNGRDVNASDSRGGTALIVASYFGSDAVARLLIEKGEG